MCDFCKEEVVNFGWWKVAPKKVGARVGDEEDYAVPIFSRNLKKVDETKRGCAAAPVGGLQAVKTWGLISERACDTEWARTCEPLVPNT